LTGRDRARLSGSNVDEVFSVNPVSITSSTQDDVAVADVGVEILQHPVSRGRPSARCRSR